MRDRDPGTATGTTTPTDSPPGVSGIRSEDGRLQWICPTCGTDNALEAPACTTCGTAFRRLFEEPERRPSVEPGRAVAFSALYPGLGHVVAGRVAEGLARAVVFSFALVIAVSLPVAGGGFALGPFLAPFLVSAGAASALYVVSMVDAGRVAGDCSPILTTRMLLYGTIGLVLLTTLGVVVLAVTRPGTG